MKTRSSEKKSPVVIEIISQSESDNISEFHHDESDRVSSVSSDSCSYVQQDEPFFNLAPADNGKKKKTMAALKDYLTEQQTNNSPQREIQQIFQRAPILDLLRPTPQAPALAQRESSALDSQQGSARQSQEVSLNPPSCSQQSDDDNDNDDELRQLQLRSQPVKKPKLMEELQRQLELPPEHFRLDERTRQLREQRKKENKRRDYLIQKKMKEYKVGKKKDTVSNQVFNAIEDFFA